MTLEQGNEGQLSRATLIKYGAFRFADVLVMQVGASFLHFFYITTYGISPLWILFARPVLKGLDVITDPILGQLSDNTKSRMGRRRPWVLFGGIALAISFMLFWTPKYLLFWIAEPTNVHIFIVYLVCYLLWFSSHTVSVVPYYALGAELTDDYNERTRVTAWRHFIALPAMIVAALTYKLATDPRIFPSGEMLGMAVCGVAVAVIVIALSAVTAFGTRERVELQRQPKMAMGEALRVTLSNRPFMVLSGCVFFYYMSYLFVLEFHAYVLTYTVFDGDKTKFGHYFFLATIVIVGCGAVANLVARGLARRIGKKTALVAFASAGLLIPAASLIAFDPSRPNLYFLFAVAVAIGITGMDIIPFSIIADICDLDELKSERRREGAFMGVYNGIIKTGLTLSPMLTAGCLVLCGFDHTLIKPGLPQSDATLHALRLALVAVPAVLTTLAVLCAMAVPISRSDVESAQAELARRREESSTPRENAC
ncbi:MAG: MFS transporter [Planctomycetota bacterium]|jgi:GPH family glycoside/pentoside/hexuronide:cation symporter